MPGCVPTRPRGPFQAGTDAGIGIVHIGQTGNTYQIKLCSVQGVTVNTSISKNIDSMITAAKKDAIHLSGAGYRTYERQAELRVSNGCPNVYISPASSCGTPTARPGFSNHEDGLAVDWSNDGSLIDSHGAAGFIWLNLHAAQYGFRNLDSEPWHWSVDGK